MYVLLRFCSAVADYWRKGRVKGMSVTDDRLRRKEIVFHTLDARI